MSDHRPLTRGALWTVGAVVVLAAVALAGACIGVARSVEPWDPLGEFPLQSITAVTVEGVDVTGTKCYLERVDVIGSFWWQTVDPPGTVASVRAGAGEDREGCITFEFVNLYPDEVLELDARLGGAVWVLAGVETPIDAEGGREGVPHTWRTEPFTIPR